MRCSLWVDCWSSYRSPSGCGPGSKADRQSAMIRITRAEVYELTLPLVEPFVISGGTMAERRSLIVALYDDAGHVGYGESPPFPLPFYSEETLTSARDLIGRVLLPRIVGRGFDGSSPLPESIDATLRESVRGNWFARAGVETAAWDLEAHVNGTGLATLLSTRLGIAPAGAGGFGGCLRIPPQRPADVLTRGGGDALQPRYRRAQSQKPPRRGEAGGGGGRARDAGA